MLGSLRNRLILSHTLPLLIIVPLIGLALIYFLETRVVLANLARQLRGQAVLVAELAAEHPAVWTDPDEAEGFVGHLNPLFSARLTLLEPDGSVVAASDPIEMASPEWPPQPTELALVRDGEESIEIDYSLTLQSESIDVMVPAHGANGEVVGIVRLNDEFGQVYERVFRLRSLTFSVLGVGLITGIALGGLLALVLERPLIQMTDALYRLASGHQIELLEEYGPEGTRLLLQSFNNLVTRLRNLEEARHHLLANLVHELGRPLGALGAAIHTLSGRAGADPELRQELLTGMKGEVQRLQRLLDDLAALHNRVLGPLELDRQPTDLDEWLRTVLVPWREAAQQKGLRWQTSLPPDLPSLSIDRDRLGQALGNLLSNAIKYTPAGGEVSVTATVEEETLGVQVSDTGPGIPEELQARIFEPFYRGQVDRRFPQGMGLGLTIARDVVTAHGGSMELQSVPGEGSCFTLWLPLDSARGGVGG
ncbi:MAG: HAMP domain-containing histidine kinase [Chloroflexota bacterium]|nr:HAMP domain-containing histidine kinase [Chloroflexota bacterium]